MNVRYTRRAVEDLTEIATYLSERNPHAAVRVRRTIEQSLTYLTAFPRAGRAQTTKGVRKLVTRK
jgi:plasmid stabilization system protein ParE